MVKKDKKYKKLETSFGAWAQYKNNDTKSDNLRWLYILFQ